MKTSGEQIDNKRLDEASRQTDPEADEAVARFLGSWQPTTSSSALDPSLEINATAWKRLAGMQQLMGQWENNAALVNWRASAMPVGDDEGAFLEHFIRSATSLPTWADPAKIERAEQLFTESGVLACALLFCASLPQCYVLPDISLLLHASGKLEAHTSHRIRSTATMILSVMMPGGLTTPQGAGLAQIFRARLIHAVVRNLVLRGTPTRFSNHSEASSRPSLPPLPMAPDGATPNAFQALYAHGWDTENSGLPCNQEELTYTLLTFSYVVLRGLRQLGIQLTPADQDAYLHTWNVIGHLMGIQDKLIVHTMDEADSLFRLLQDRHHSQAVAPDHRPELAMALIRTMEQSISTWVLKPLPLYLTTYLCGKDASRKLGLEKQVSWPLFSLFSAAVATAKMIDRVNHWLWPRFSITAFIGKLLGFQFLTKILLNERQPLNLSAHLRAQTEVLVRSWLIAR